MNEEIKQKLAALLYDYRLRGGTELEKTCEQVYNTCQVPSEFPEDGNYNEPVYTLLSIALQGIQDCQYWNKSTTFKELPEPVLYADVVIRQVNIIIRSAFGYYLDQVEIHRIQVTKNH